MDLTGFQERLAKQYARLRNLRAADKYPVYAIEHGLSADERATAQEQLNGQLKTSRLADRAHWLVWIAATAEVGYQYDGSEYWDSFATAFPNWRQFGDRNQIRAWYQRFAAEFGGLTPQGPWARKFPIIAWPITQAILPRYLQRHFADHLFQLRHSLTRSGELTLEEIGNLLSERYVGGSSRFEGFLQQRALTARIVMALGLDNVADIASPIEQGTLERIARDFDKLGHSGARLRESRRVLREVRFINSAKSGFALAAQRLPVEHHQLPSRAEVPRLVARQKDAQSWDVALTVPDLATPLRHLGLTPHDLERERMRFRPFGDKRAWMPGRALFSYVGQSTEPLETYPSTERQILEFDRAVPQGETALRDRLKLLAQPLRLMKIRTDGLAFEVTGKHVRAGQSYVLISKHAITDDVARSLSLSPQTTALFDTQLWRLDVDQGVDATQIAALKSLGLGYSLGVRMETVGLSPRWNPANGALQFLDTEAVLFKLCADVAVREYAVTLDGDLPIHFKPEQGRDTFVSFGPLGIGAHRIAVSAMGAATGSSIDSDELAIEVRSCNPWQQAIVGRAGVSLFLDPRYASIEQLLRGDAVIKATAPRGRNVELHIRLFGPDGALAGDEKIGRFTTPVPEQKLNELFVQRLNADAMAERVERAVRIELAVSLDEYGAECITFEKDAETVRWLRVDGSTLRLSDDTAGEEKPSIECYDLNAVEKPRAVDYQVALDGIKLRGKGGLLLAKHNGKRYAVFATVARSQFTTFSDLGVPASTSSTNAKPTTLINALKRWRDTTRLMGPMASIGQRNATQALERRLELALCGEDWSTAASSVRAGKLSIGTLYGRVFNSRGFASGLRAFAWRYDEDEAAAVAEFLRLASHVHKVSGDEKLCRLALKVAFAPWTVAPSNLPSSDALDLIKANRALIRGAYFARLATDIRAHSDEAGGAG